MSQAAPIVLREVASVVVKPRGGRYDLALNTPDVRALRGGPDGLVAKWTQRAEGVRIAILAAGEARAEDVEIAIAQAIALAGLDDDPSELAALVARHPLLEAIHRTYAGARITRTPTVFEAFATAVVQQLVTWIEASGALRRLSLRYGEAIPGTTLRAPPTAEAIARVPPFELRAYGVGLRRATTLLEGARRGPALERLREVPPEEAMSRIQSMRGVGIWTANKVALHALGYADACLVGDAGAPFVTTMALTGRAGGDAEMLACLEPFRPHRARVHRLLELAARRGDGIPGVPPRPLPRVDPHRRHPWRTG